MMRTKLFISYSHRDQNWLDLVMRHLAVLERKGVVHVWSDTRIGAGGRWKEEIDKALQESRVAVLLVSPNFLASEFIWREEMTEIVRHRDQENGLIVLPLIIRPCAWMLAPELDGLQARPRDGRALALGTDAEIDRDLADFVIELATRVEQLPDKFPEALASIEADFIRSAEPSGLISSLVTTLADESEPENIVVARPMAKGQVWIGNYLPTKRELKLLVENRSGEKFSGRIFYVGDGSETASQNLKFLIDTGLVMNPERVTKINEYLKANPNDGPVLPISGDHYNIESTNALSKASVELLESSLHDYTVYFDRLGFKVPSKKVPIRVEDSAQMRPGWASYYDPGSETIIIDSSIVSDVDAPRREYTHFILLQDRSDLNMNNPHTYLIESDLADYFVCSFAKRPKFAQNVASVLKLGTPYVRTLDNQNTFSRSMDATDAFMKGREIWGGAFWAIRSSLTAEVADKILAKAWQRLGPVEMGGDAASKFITALISAAIEGGSPEARSTITNILRQRKFPLPT